jgi:hypothetical protein
MTKRIVAATPQVANADWVPFPGGELEGTRSRTLCQACRARLAASVLAGAAESRHPGTLCFECYRVGFERDRALRRAAALDTASEARFQSALPFEPVNHARLARLKFERTQARAALQASPLGRFVDRRYRAQMAARHALERVAAGLKARAASPAEINRSLAEAAHAAELQLPDAWLPFVVSR